MRLYALLLLEDNPALVGRQVAQEPFDFLYCTFSKFVLK